MPTDPPPATPEPALPMPDAGQALAAYVRPSPRDPSLRWLELAAPQGRWAVLYDTALCVPPAPWTNVWLALDEASTRPITVERSGTGMCALAQWTWTSDVPCATNGAGVCEAAADPAGWPPAAAEPPPELPAPQPTAEPTPLPPTAVPVRRAAPAPPPAPQVQVVVQTVVVTAVPTDTPIPEATATPRPTATRTPTIRPSPTRAPAAPPTSTTAPLVGAATATPRPAVDPTARAATSAPGRWDWGSFLEAVASVLVLLVVAAWLLTRRRVVVWGAPRSKQTTEDSHA